MEKANFPKKDGCWAEVSRMYTKNYFRMVIFSPTITFFQPSMKTFLFWLAFLSGAAFGQLPGDLDSTFNNNPNEIPYAKGEVGANNIVNKILRQSDGKLIIVGEFDRFNGDMRYRIVRTSPNGEIDPSFEAQSGIDYTAEHDIYDVIQQPDGKLIIGGSFFYYNETNRSRIARINADGSLDLSFNPSASSYVNTLAIDNDNKILVGGEFITISGSTVNRFARLNPDGSLDATFNTGTGFNDAVFSIIVQPDGKILVAGDFTQYNGANHRRIIRLNEDGSVDATFNTGTGFISEAKRMLLLSDGRILLAGNFSSYNGTAIPDLVVLLPDGSLDPAFNSGTGPTGGLGVLTYVGPYEQVKNVFDMKELPDGRIVLVGDFATYNGISCEGTAIINPDGSFDSPFNTLSTSEIRTALVENDGSVLIGGKFNSFGTWYCWNRLAKLTPGGELDLTFMPVVGASLSVKKIRQTTDNKMILQGGGVYNNVNPGALTRIFADGQIDTTFLVKVSGGDITDFYPLPDGKVVIGGTFTQCSSVPRNRIARVLPDGSIDLTFNPGTGANLEVLQVAAMSDGRIVVAGLFETFNGQALPYVVRLMADGSVDPSFTPDPNIEDVTAFALLQNDRIIVIGDFSETPILLSDNGSVDISFQTAPLFSSPTFVRALPDGKILFGNGTAFRKTFLNGDEDPSFDDSYLAIGGDDDILIQEDGKILTSGFSGYDHKVQRFFPNGLPDATFNDNREDYPLPDADDWFQNDPFGSPWALGLQQNGKLLLGGNFTRYQEQMYNGIVRLHCTEMLLTIDSIHGVDCSEDAYIEVSGHYGMPPYEYEWQTTPAIGGPVLQPNTGGIYTCVLTDANGDHDSLSVLIQEPGTIVGYDMNVNLSATQFRPGFASTCWIDAFNDGCVPATGQLKLAYDPLLNFVSSDPTPSSVNGDTLIWDFANMVYNDPHLTPVIQFTTSFGAMIGDSIRFSAIITPVAGDANPANNNKQYAFPVLNGYDPNTKSVYPVGKCDEGYIEPDQLLTYTIHFQNTGNSEAINIAVVDPLDTDLDLNTVRVIGQSHDLWTEVLPGNVLKFHFEDIHLADSTSNEPESHGYVIFEAKPVAGVAHQTEIKNKAEIYFDFNPAIVTNTVSNAIYNGDLESFDCSDLGVAENDALEILLYPNPTSCMLTIAFGQELQDATLLVTDIQGKEILKRFVSGNTAVVDLSSVKSGIYFVSVYDRNGKLIDRNHKISKTND